jgi:uncharacterized protein YjeT (DUF2065 family)
MNVKKAYYYLYYKLYRLFEWTATSPWWSEWKALAVIDLLGFMIAFSFLTYYNIFVDRNLIVGHGPVKVISLAVFILGIVLPNFLIFTYRDQWKNIAAKFDQLPKLKNRIGSLIVFGVIVLILANLIYSFYLDSQVDWSPYRN